MVTNLSVRNHENVSHLRCSTWLRCFQHRNQERYNIVSLCIVPLALNMVTSSSNLKPRISIVSTILNVFAVFSDQNHNNYISISSSLLLIAFFSFSFVMYSYKSPNLKIISHTSKKFSLSVIFSFMHSINNDEILLF